MPAAAPDPTSLEIARKALEGISDTMAIALYRTARSAVARLGWDFSTAVLTETGDLVGQGMCHPIHLGGMMPALQGCLRHYSGRLAPGDILINNDPYEGAQHLPDIYLFKPVFAEGAPIAFAGAICHQADIGGRVPGGQGFDNVEIYQEGLRIPPLKLYERGAPNETLLRIIEKAVRVPDQVQGDLRALVTAVNVGEAEILRLVERLGPTGFRRLADQLIDYTERLTRQRIAELPDGSWSFTDYIDDDRISGEQVAVCARVTKTGDEIHIDFDGSSPQVKGSITGLFHMNANFVQMALRCLLGADIPNTAGFFRPLRITAPPGSFVDPLPPAAVGARVLGGRRINHAVWGALAQMAPDRVFACPGGSDASMATSGLDRSVDPPRPWVLTEGLIQDS
jgi:N-methylhydantoinase B